MDVYLETCFLCQACRCDFLYKGGKNTCIRELSFERARGEFCVRKLMKLPPILGIEMLACVFFFLELHHLMDFSVVFALYFFEFFLLEMWWGNFLTENSLKIKFLFNSFIYFVQLYNFCKSCETGCNNVRGF